MRVSNILVLGVVALLVSGLVGCPQSVSLPPKPAAVVCPTTASAETVRIFEGLQPQCQGCHVAGERGYFKDVAAFQALVVADPRFVVPGSPDESVFVALLEGRATGSFSQMPPAGPAYAALVDAGDATLTVADVRSWIATLSAQARSSDPDVEAPHITRLSATQARRTLYQQLGLDDADFFIPADEYGIEMAESRGDDNHPFLSGDDLPAPRQRVTFERHAGLGGGSVVEQTREDATASVNFVNNLVPISQRWCRMALGKAGNTALFDNDAGRQDESEANVTATLHRWSRHFHAVAIDDAEAAALYRDLFLALRADPAGDLDSAWSGVCSYFIRHPRWIFY